MGAACSAPATCQASAHSNEKVAAYIDTPGHMRSGVDEGFHARVKHEAEEKAERASMASILPGGTSVRAIGGDPVSTILPIPRAAPATHSPADTPAAAGTG